MEEKLEGQKLLIVDDDNVWLNQLSRAMSRRGLTVYEAQSVKDALDILLDRELPDKVKEEIAKEILKHPKVHGFHDMKTRALRRHLQIP